MTLYLQILAFIAMAAGCFMTGYYWHKGASLKRIYKLTNSGKSTVDFNDLLYIVTGKR